MLRLSIMELWNYGIIYSLRIYFNDEIDLLNIME